MKYGIYYAYWEQEWGGDVIPYIHRVKRLGFDILEVGCHNFIDVDDDYLRLVKQTAEEEGIMLTGGYGNDIHHNISSSDPAVVRASMEKFEGTFRKMYTAGIHKLGGSLYSYWPVDYSRPIDKPGDWKRAVRNMRELADIAKEYEITLGMEVLNRFEGYLLNTCAEAVDYVSEVDRENVKVMLDTFHMNIEEDSFGDAVRLAGKLLGHVHVGEANRRPPSAKGRIPWAEIGVALNDIHYDGTVVMEPFVRPGGTVGNEIRIWRDLSEGAANEQLDADAANAVRFLRGLWG
ncbi:MAG: sugar phosphate isomerase/epimerase [Lachnospiraceae bacterium]|nr:sugar phosphate isomerase/epimerase [Lachnospiraceae bacterium]